MCSFTSPAFTASALAHTPQSSEALTGPGATAFTRIPLGASWRERERVNATMAPLVELHGIGWQECFGV